MSDDAPELPSLDLENLYSSDLQETAAGDIPDPIQRAIRFLQQHSEVDRVYRRGQCEIKNTHHIGVAALINLARHLPPRYDSNEHDIHTQEPVLFLFDKKQYPFKAPRVASDRTNFRWQDKPHISQADANWPPYFCLSRVPLDDWFAEHGFAQFYDRTVEWLHDAARGNLQRDDGRFEPTIMRSSWYCQFDYEETVRWIDKQRRFKKEPSRSFAQFEMVRYESGDQHPGAYRITLAYRGAISLGEIERFAKESSNVVRLGGLIAWTPQDSVSENYLGRLPSSREELTEWMLTLNIDLEDSIEKLVAPYEWTAQDSGRTFDIFPILIAIQRPRKLFGVESTTEIICFALVVHHEAGQEYLLPVHHEHPHTPRRAQELSNIQQLDVPLALVGGGALGSKVFMHWYRSGHTRWMLVDDDLFRTHNQVRHSLLPTALHQPKVQGLKRAVADMYEAPEDNIHTADENLRDLLSAPTSRDRLEECFLVDCTASQSTLRLLTQKELGPAGVARCALVDEGRKATLSIEGPERNPRLDDIQAYLYHLGLKEDVIAQWLTNRATQNNELAGLHGHEVELGLGCASDTFRLADDEVSLHAAQLSLRLKQWLDIYQGPASALNAENPHASGGRVGVSSTADGWREWRVPPVTVLTSSGWQLRISEAMVITMSTLMDEFSPNETGGIVLGRVDFSRQIVYAVRALPPPADSVCEPTRFVRGDQGVLASHEDALKRTGNAIGYVGEWHSHPRGPRAPSGKDTKTVEDTLDHLRGSEFPAVLIGMASSGPFAYVRDPLEPREAFVSTDTD